MALTQTHENTHAQLADLRSELREANQKLDHIINRLGENYFRRFYDLYGPEADG